MEEKKTKLCKTCYQEIDIRARRCPYCHYWQRKLSIIIYHPLFSVLTIFLFIACWCIVASQTSKSVRKRIVPLYKEFNRDSGIVIKSHHEWKPAEDIFNVIGVIANTGADGWSGINIEVELFDKDGKFVYECSGYIGGILYPGEEENFVVSCSGCDKAPIPPFDIYDIKIKNAYYKSIDKHKSSNK